MSAIPYGPENKDPMWRWGSFAMGVVGFVLLYWLMTLFDTLILGWQRVFILIVIAVLLSVRSGRRWASGRDPERTPTRTIQPTVSVEGKAGATYVLLEPAKAPKGAKVKPEEFGPLWWAFYTVLVRAPVALGDAILTTVWRLGGRFDTGGVGRGRNVGSDDIDFLNELPDPGRRQF